MAITEARSTTDQSNIQEVLDAEANTGFSSGKQEQYFTPSWLVNECNAKLPSKTPATALDPQCGEGSLLFRDGYNYGTMRFGIELDNRIDSLGGVQLITGNCMKVFEIIDDLYPDTQFVCVNANPPFGRRWKKANGDWVDSTRATWDFALKHGNYGYFISNRLTIEKLGLNKHPWVYDYVIKKGNEIWRGMRAELEIGIVFWNRPDQRSWTPAGDIRNRWDTIAKAVDQEKILRPKFNIYITNEGILKTYLSIRNTVKLKLTQADIMKMARINDCHPLTLTTEKETRSLMRSLVDCGIYTIQPEAKEAIESALKEVNALACPIMPVTDFETVAYADEEDALVCRDLPGEFINISLSVGKSYPLTTGTYKFTENFKRNKVHYNDERMETYTCEHDCVLSGSDRYIEIKDDHGRVVRFMDRPRQGVNNEFDEKLLWQFFKKPVVNTVADVFKEAIAQNVAVLKALEMTAGYEYYRNSTGGGQMGYLARVATKNAALVAAETGAGKSLMAISLLAMKSPYRSLIIAPQGSIRPTESDDDDETIEMNASQWLKEINRFAPYLQVFELFTYEDYERICSLNGGELPPGVYVSYYEAMFSNGAREKVPDSWDDHKLNKWAKSMGYVELPVNANEAGALLDARMNCDTVGQEKEGIRCIIAPCLATMVGDKFDCVMLDEAHRATNLNANLTQMLIRMQPTYRYALTATPIPNIISNLFSLMGWLAVPEWYKGGKLNAAFPYAREDIGRFNSTFLSMERDLTAEEMNRQKDPKWKGTCIKESPIISSPARLLKILKPTMAFISKQDVNDKYIPPKVIDVRVNMGKEQTLLYGHFLDRANISATNALVRAQKQTAYLRNICADPAGFRHGGPKVFSNMNPKVIAILELTRDILARGEQVVIINSRIGISSTLHEKLCDAGVRIARIDSTIPAEQHSQQANLLKTGKADVMLMGIKCAAAYSFDDIPNEIIGSLEFSPGPFNQAKGRIDRVTNKTVKNIYCILHRNSMEEIMFDTVATKDDAATICLRGCRVPRDFKPHDPSELMAKAIERFDLSGGTPEPECERQWPKLRDAIRAIRLN